MSSITQLSATQIRDLLERREVSSVEVTQAYLNRIEAVDRQVAAFLWTDPDYSLRQAHELDERRARGATLGCLSGVPVAVKDVVCTRGLPTTCASRMLADFRPPYNATVIDKLNASDGVLLGKTNLDEFAMGGSTENSAFAPTRNPWDLQRVPGGSSGGAAACVAAGMAPLSIGTDTGGSIRQPAAYCGVVGLKPTYGRVSRYGLVAFASSLDQIGPLAGSVQDLALLLEAIAGHDPADATSAPIAVPPYSRSVQQPLAGLKLGLAEQHYGDGLDSEVAALTESAIDVYRQLGAEIRSVSLDHSRYAIAAYYIIAPSEASSNLARYDGVHYGYRTDEASMMQEWENERRRLMAAGDEAGLEALESPLVRMYRRTRAEGFGTEVKRRIMLGTYALSAGYYDAYYLKALKVRRLIREDYDRAFEHVDFILGPVTPSPAFPLRRNGGRSVVTLFAGPVHGQRESRGHSQPGDALRFYGQWASRGPPGPGAATAGGTVVAGRRNVPARNRLAPAETCSAMTDPSYELIIGLEVHVQLATDSKLFCRCSTQFGAAPNTQTCPVCTGAPGSLPVMNERAFRLALVTAVALNCEIPEFTKWDRKQYYYPDLPKGYQISQFDLPMSRNGWLEISDSQDRFPTKRVGIIRAHLEEDAGKSMHDEVAGRADSRIDLNRTGTPLLEIVSEPDMRSPLEAKAYLTELKLLLSYLGVSDCNMQEGSLRVDANVNLKIPTDDEWVPTPIVEVKNMNSFRAVERALAYEAERQIAVWQETHQRLGDVPKQTRGWDDQTLVTKPQRSKEESSDYRYFPDPDLTPVVVTASQREAARASLGELPAALRQRLQQQYDLTGYDADVLVNQGRAVVDYFVEAADVSGDAKKTSNWIQRDVMAALNESNVTIDAFGISASRLAELVTAVNSGELQSSRATDVFTQMRMARQSLQEAMRALGIEQVDESELIGLCRQILQANPRVVADVQAGKQQAVGALIGQAKKSNPNVDPSRVRALCLSLISELPAD